MKGSITLPMREVILGKVEKGYGEKSRKDLVRTETNFNIGYIMLGGTPRALNEFSRRFGPVTPERILALKEALRSAETDHVVLSSKMLYEFSDAEFIGNLCVELDDIFDEIRVIVYFRHQIDHFPLLVTQRVKAGMKDWAQIIKVPDAIYRYDEICALWDQDVDVIARDYGRCKDDVIGDFCAAVGLPVPEVTVARRPHPTLDARALKLLLLINSSSAPSKDSVRRRIADELEGLTLSKQTFKIGRDLADEIAERFEAGNQRLSEQYLGGLALLRQTEKR